MLETRVRSLGGEDPLEEGMSCLGPRSLAGYGLTESDTTEAT